MNEFVEHNSVLLQESINLLVNNKNGIYLDGTFGGGGHSKHILNKIDNNGKLIGVADGGYARCTATSPGSVFLGGKKSVSGTVEKFRDGWKVVDANYTS